MALEDFFTLTEMKAGISSTDRVEELINLMRIEKDKDVKNGERSRQLLTVVKIIACTDNKECLDRFIQLDGLCFFNTWLNHIEKSASDIPDGFEEESFVALLQALEKLPVDDEKLTSSGVGITLKSLVVHCSSEIKERVNALLDGWKLPSNSSKVDVDVKEDMSANSCTNVSIKPNESSSAEILHLDENNERKSNSGISDSLPGNLKVIPKPENGIDVGRTDTSDPEVVNNGNSVVPISTDLCIVKENVSITGFTDTRKESSLNSKREEEGEGEQLEQQVDVLADVESAGNGKTTTSIEHSRDNEQPLSSSFPETQGSSLRSDDAEAGEALTKASEKDPAMAVSEGMEIDIPLTVCSSSLGKMLDCSTEELSKSLPQMASTGKEFSSDSETAKAEDDLDGIKHSHVNAVVAQEAEIKTRAALGFDLNEEVISEDYDPLEVPNQDLNCNSVDHQMNNQTSMATSVISASRPATVSGLPAGRLQFEGNLGWKGSAATSAFRPASPRKPLESDNMTSSTSPNNSQTQKQYLHDFDLNMADDENADTPDSINAVSSSHPSDESCVEIGPTKLKRVELDLNSLGDAPPSAYWNVNGLPFSQQNVYRTPSPASSSSSAHPSTWDLDLNKKLSMPIFPYDPPYPGNPMFNFFEGSGDRKPALVQPFMYRPGIPNTMFDPRGSSGLPHTIGPAQPPYLMMSAPPPQAPLSTTPHSYSSFDPSMLYMNDAANRSEPHTRQYLMSTQGGFLEPHSTVPQPSSFLTKRKEPHSGSDPYHHGFSNHHESPGKS